MRPPCELSLAERVEARKSLRELRRVFEPGGHELDPADDLQVGQQHHHAAKVRLQVFRKLFAARALWVHSDENAALLAHSGDRAIGEMDRRHALTQRREYAAHLLGNHRDDVKVEAVELVEARPAARLRQTLEDGAHRAAIHLCGAVHRDDVLAESVAHVLHGLGLARGRRASGCAPQKHPERLRESDEAAIGERRDAKPVLHAQILVAVAEMRICDRDACRLEVHVPIGACLPRPPEVRRAPDTLESESSAGVALMDSG
eukprot:scaffold1202_cov110-Isochrysis_galbana.AAC.9